VAWLEQLAHQRPIHQLISAHYDAPLPLKTTDLERYGEVVRAREWAPSNGNWHTLAAIDQALLRFGVVKPTEK
jgi:hypothetical protein